MRNRGGIEVKALILIPALLILACSAPFQSKKLTRIEYYTEIRADFDKNCYRYLNSEDMSFENKLWLIGSWWDLQEMKAITKSHWEK
jgi:hypothetical protein